MNPERAVAYRKQVCALLDAVLAEEITPRTAINCWPTYANQDPSVRCAYTMLWYFEADEDRHHLELYYSDLQLKTLREAANHLRQGESLPAALMHEYQGASAPPEYSGAHTWQDPLNWLIARWKETAAILETHRWFRPKATKTPKRPR